MSSLLDRLLSVAKDFEAERFQEQVEHKKELRTIEQQMRTLRETSQNRLEEISFLEAQLENAHAENKELHLSLEKSTEDGNASERVGLIREIVALRFLAADLAAKNKILESRDKENANSANTDDKDGVKTDGEAGERPPKGLSFVSEDKVNALASRQSFYDAVLVGDKDKMLSILQPGVTFQDEFLGIVNSALLKGCGGASLNSAAPKTTTADSLPLEGSGAAVGGKKALGEGKQMEVIDVLLAAGATMTARGSAAGAANNAGGTKSLTPLHAAAGSGSALVVESILAQPGVNVNALDGENQTAMHMAAHATAKVSTAAILKALLMAGCDLTIANKEGKTAMDILESIAAQEETKHPEQSAVVARVNSAIESFKDPTTRFWNCSVRAFDAYSSENFKVALDVYAEAIQLVTEFGLPVSKEDQSRLYYNRARALCHLNQRLKAVEDLESALDLSSEYTNARALLAQCHFELFQYDRCVQGLKVVLEKDRTNAKWSKLIGEARRLRDASHYDVLGITRGTDEAGIKKAYRRGSIKWHPDKHRDHPDNTARANTMFKRVNEANQVLGDSYKKLLYDVELDRKKDEFKQPAAPAPRRASARSEFESRYPPPSSAARRSSKASMGGQRDVFKEIFSRRDMDDLEEEYNNWQRVSVDTHGVMSSDGASSDYYDEEDEEEIFGY